MRVNYSTDGTCPKVNHWNFDSDIIPRSSLSKQRNGSQRPPRAPALRLIFQALVSKPFSVVCVDVCVELLPCRHTGGRFLCIPQGERIDSTSIHVWTSEESSHHPPSQTGSLYSQVWKAWRSWATGWRAPTGTGSDWLSWYPIRCERSWTALELWQWASDGMNTRGQCHPSMHCIPHVEFL